MSLIDQCLRIWNHRSLNTFIHVTLQWNGATMSKLRNSIHLRYGVASKKWAAAVSCPADRATQSSRAPRASVCLNVQFYGPQEVWLINGTLRWWQNSSGHELFQNHESKLKYFPNFIVDRCMNEDSMDKCTWLSWTLNKVLRQTLIIQRVNWTFDKPKDCPLKVF